MKMKITIEAVSTESVTLRAGARMDVVASHDGNGMLQLSDNQRVPKGTYRIDPGETCAVEPWEEEREYQVRCFAGTFEISVEEA